MRKVFLRVILFSAIIALFALALAPAFALAAGNDMGGSHCGVNPPAAGAPASNNCLAHCEFIQCQLSSAADARIVSLSSQDTFNLPVCLTTTSATEIPSISGNAAPPPPVDGSPPIFNVTYQCRNSLNSEDPVSP